MISRIDIVLVGALLSLLAYWLLPSRKRWRQVFLIGLSLLVIGYVDRMALLFPGAAIIIYFLTRRARTGFLITGLLVLFPLIYLSFFKYIPELVRLYSPAGDSLFATLLLPLGISYITFKVIHYVVEARHHTLGPHGLLDFLLYLVFLPIFPAGPIERFDHFIEQAQYCWNQDRFVSGVWRIINGLAKKLLLVELLLLPLLVDLASETTGGALTTWLYLILSFLHVYLDFSAYTDLAIGVSRLFGLDVMENFRFPWLARSIADFWKRWHMTLSQWTQYYVYLPVIGLTRNTAVALVLSMVTIGLWHGATPNRLLWGVYHGVALVMSTRFTQWRRQQGVLAYLDHTLCIPIRMVAVFLFVSFGYVFIKTKTLSGAVEMGLQAFGF